MTIRNVWVFKIRLNIISKSAQTPLKLLLYLPEGIVSFYNSDNNNLFLLHQITKSPQYLYFTSPTKPGRHYKSVSIVI